MISHRHQLIFIHIPKCAGRSISDALGEPFDHYTAAYYEAQHTDIWHKYNVFTMVRNPYQRLVSMYHYIKNEPFHAHHPITRCGNMLPFTDWVYQNLLAFGQPFDQDSPEGNRETDGHTGSPFWFSSQSRRISDASGSLYGNIHLLRYEEGMKPAEQFLHHRTGSSFSIAHLNYSPGNRQHYLSYYDDELLSVVNTFTPFVHDCKTLGYPMIAHTRLDSLTS